MFIRRTATRNTTTGESYTTFRLVRSERIGRKVRQVTLLNLGRHFAVPQDEWPRLCARIEELLSGQAGLIPSACLDSIEAAAQNYAGRLVLSAPVIETAPGALEPAFYEVDVNSLEDRQPRSVGVEHVALAAMGQLGFEHKLEALGVNGLTRAAVIGSVIARMAKPSSELAAWHWLKNESGLGELIDADFEAMPLTRLYRASDVLIKHRAAIEDHLFASVRGLFSLEETLTLYDLTNTYFEGQCAGNKKACAAARSRSDPMRPGSPWLWCSMAAACVAPLAAVRGQRHEAKTLEQMLLDLQAPSNALVICDAGIATEQNITWLIDNGYRYLVVSRERARQFDAEQAIAFEAAGGETIRAQKLLSEDGREVHLYCHSPGREHKEQAITGRLVERFEKALTSFCRGPEQAARREALRQDPGAHRAAQGEKPWHRPALPDQRSSRRVGQEGHLDQLAEAAQARHHAHRSGRVLPAHQ